MAPSEEAYGLINRKITAANKDGELHVKEQRVVGPTAVDPDIVWKVLRGYSSLTPLHSEGHGIDSNSAS